MDIVKRVKRIEELSFTMKDALEVDRAIIYAAIKTLTDEITATIQKNKKKGYVYVEEKLLSLGWHAESLAHLDDGNGHSDEQHYLWLLGQLRTIKNNIESI